MDFRRTPRNSCVEFRRAGLLICYRNSIFKGLRGGGSARGDGEASAATRLGARSRAFSVTRCVPVGNVSGDSLCAAQGGAPRSLAEWITHSPNGACLWPARPGHRLRTSETRNVTLGWRCQFGSVQISSEK